MNVAFDKITEKTARYEISGEEWFPEELGCFVAGEPVWVSVYKCSPDSVVLKGCINGVLHGVCARCGVEVKDTLYSSFEYLVTTKEEEVPDLQEVECSESEVNTLYLLDPEIDVDEILQEQAYLESPIRMLCSETCKGVCAGCGAVLNSESCSCSADNSDSPFAILGQIINK